VIPRLLGRGEARHQNLTSIDVEAKHPSSIPVRSGPVRINGWPIYGRRLQRARHYSSLPVTKLAAFPFSPLPPVRIGNKDFFSISTEILDPRTNQLGRIRGAGYTTLSNYTTLRAVSASTLELFLKGGEGCGNAIPTLFFELP
jgi:hypothetical protein